VGRIPEETIEQVLAATDIVDIISGYIPLKRAGSSFKALCPFHNERTPSFNVNPAAQSFHCFGCGASGSAIGFVMQYENLPFTDSVRKLAQRAGVSIVEETFDPKEERKRRMRSRLIELHNAAAEFMHKMLMRSPAAAHGRDYLKGRGFDGETAKRWKLGWMPDNPQLFTNWVNEQGFTGQELIASGMAGLRDENNPKAGLWVRFRNRLMFPIYNDYGDIVAFSGRQLVEDPNSGKYINSPETIIFNKSKIFFGLDKARRHMSKAKCALLCEGQIDAISCVEHGIEYAIAPLGTAFTEHHARLLKRYTPKVILCFDADGAGHKAIRRAHDILVPQGIHVTVVKMPQGEDPDSFIKKHGVEDFQKLVDESMGFFDYMFAVEREKRDLTNIQERADLANELSKHASLVSDKLTREGLIQQIAAQLSVGSEDVRNSVVLAERKKKFQKNYDRDKPEEEEQKVQPTVLDGTIATLCYLALHSKEAQQSMCEHIEALDAPLNDSFGGHILRSILSKRPEADKASAIQAFLLSLPSADRQGLTPHLTQALPEDPLAAAEEATAFLINTHLQRREAAIRAALRSGSLSPQETTELLQEAQEITELLRGTTQRFIR